MQKLIFNSFLIILVIMSLFSYLDANEGPLQYPEPAEGWDDGDCQSLQIQSPINIPSTKDDSVVIDDGTHANIKSLSYSKITSAKVEFDKGHKWTTEELDIGYIEIELNQTLYKYKLNSFHFHLNSEHRIENHQYPMEMHIVHKNTNKTDKENENLVIGILFDYSSEEDNQFLEDIKLSSEEEIENASILSLINKNEEFYYYKGGLTTVPCTENVNWIVFKKIIHMSFNQFNNFQKWIENSDLKYYGTGYGNARGPKRLSGRKIYLENSQMSFFSKILSTIIYYLTFLFRN